MILCEKCGARDLNNIARSRFSATWESSSRAVGAPPFPNRDKLGCTRIGTVYCVSACHSHILSRDVNLARDRVNLESQCNLWRVCLQAIYYLRTPQQTSGLCVRFVLSCLETDCRTILLPTRYICIACTAARSALVITARALLSLPERKPYLKFTPCHGMYVCMFVTSDTPKSHKLAIVSYCQLNPPCPIDRWSQ